MHRVRLVHWHEGEAAERAAQVRALGYEVNAAPVHGNTSLKELYEDPPDAVVIDLSRLPSHGRELALAIRSSKTLRHVPLVFVHGAPDKVERLKALLPDAMYAEWRDLGSTLRRAITAPPSTPAVPSSQLAGQASTPLVTKLGIQPGSVVVLVGAPETFASTLGELPEGATLRWQNRGRRDLTLWFPASQRELAQRLNTMAKAMGHGSMWIIWPKQSAQTATDLNEAVVRTTGLEHGLVDHKICAVDATYSGLRFARRKGA